MNIKKLDGYRQSEKSSHSFKEFSWMIEPSHESEIPNKSIEQYYDVTRGATAALKIIYKSQLDRDAGTPFLAENLESDLHRFVISSLEFMADDLERKIEQANQK